jgi:hypothetical protein
MKNISVLQHFCFLFFNRVLGSPRSGSPYGLAASLSPQGKPQGPLPRRRRIHANHTGDQLATNHGSGTSRTCEKNLLLKKHFRRGTAGPETPPVVPQACGRLQGHLPVHPHNFGSAGASPSQGGPFAPLNTARLRTHQPLTPFVSFVVENPPRAPLHSSGFPCPSVVQMPSATRMFSASFRGKRPSPNHHSTARLNTHQHTTHSCHSWFKIPTHPTPCVSLCPSVSSVVKKHHHTTPNTTPVD